jgi:hypothetical protein
MAAAQMLVDVEEGDNDDGSYEQPRDIVGVGGGGRGGGDAGFRRRSGLIIKKPFGASRATEATRVSGGGSEMFAWSTEDVCEWLAREDFRGVDVTAAVRERHVVGKDLVNFDKECWAELGVSSALHRARLMGHLQQALQATAGREGRAGNAANGATAPPVGAGGRAAGAWTTLTKTVFPRSHSMIAADHCKEWHDRIADSGRDPEEIRSIMKGHNESYLLMFLLLFSAIVPLGFSVPSFFKIEWTQEGKLADGISIYGLVWSFYFSMLVMILFMCIAMTLPIGAAIDACSKANLVIFLKGPGNRMITDLSASAVFIIFMTFGFFCLSFPILLGRNAPWWWQLAIALGAFNVGPMLLGMWVGSVDDNSRANRRFGLVNGMRDFLLFGYPCLIRVRLSCYLMFIYDLCIVVRLIFLK